MSRTRWFLFALALAASLGAVWLTSGSAQSAPPPAVLTPVPTQATDAAKPVTLAVKATDPATNRPIAGLQVQFFVLTDVFGQRLMSVGQATTDAAGMAAVQYKPSWEGPTQVTYRFGGNALYGAAQATSQFVAVGPIPLHENADFGLDTVRSLAPVVVIGLVIAVWATLIGVVLHTARGIRMVPLSPEVPAAAASSPLIAGRRRARPEPESTDGGSGS
jgi:hypothetical protein